MLIGSCSRYVGVGRSAVQTVYWRAQPTTNGQNIGRIIKTKKLVTFPNSDKHKPNISTSIKYNKQFL
ncbi:hypothetical protein O3M35_006310 [Rhynocoris fuscipes]|uniref:Uncharacterized protein n=1 Tax=Rhynocoris fuscipes TaxID=488301 RepID=A0AAW1DCY5_9HEMI